MRKGIVVALVTTVVGLLVMEGDADARRRRRRAKAASSEAPVSAEISKALPLPWGTGHSKVISHYTDQIRTAYRAKLGKATGAIEEDRLRTEMDREIAKIRDSYIEFRGQRTGWRVSFIGEEFRDSAGQSMVVVQESNAQRFYFFHNDQLRKMFVAFNAEVFPGLNFEQFAERIQQRYGPAQRVTKTNARTQQEELVELRWQDQTTRLAAIDQTGFYGIFSLRFMDKNVPQDQAVAAADRSNTLLDSAIREGQGDAHSDVVDRITGRRRAAPGGSGGATPTARPGARPGSSRPGGPPPGGTAAPPRPERDDDPMAGLADL